MNFMFLILLEHVGQIADLQPLALREITKSLPIPAEHVGQLPDLIDLRVRETARLRQPVLLGEHVRQLLDVREFRVSEAPLPRRFEDVRELLDLINLSLRVATSGMLPMKDIGKLLDVLQLRSGEATLLGTLPAGDQAVRQVHSTSEISFFLDVHLQNTP